MVVWCICMPSSSVIGAHCFAQGLPTRSSISDSLIVMPRLFTFAVHHIVLHQNMGDLWGRRLRGIYRARSFIGMGCPSNHCGDLGQTVLPGTRSLSSTNVILLCSVNAENGLGNFQTCPGDGARRRCKARLQPEDDVRWWILLLQDGSHRPALMGGEISPCFNASAAASTGASTELKTWSYRQAPCHHPYFHPRNAGQPSHQNQRLPKFGGEKSIAIARGVGFAARRAKGHHELVAMNHGKRLDLVGDQQGVFSISKRTSSRAWARGHMTFFPTCLRAWPERDWVRHWAMYLPISASTLIAAPFCIHDQET